MVILVLGNGFDLAHKLRTGYVNFLEFTQSFWKVYNNTSNEKKDQIQDQDNSKNSYIDRLLSETLYADEFCEMTKTNFWVKYFINKYHSIGTKWIDFETEISRVIQQIEADRKSEASSYDGEIKFLSDDVVETAFQEVGEDTSQYSDLFKRMEYDLQKLIRGFEIYLAVCVNRESTDSLSVISELNPDKVLSFNYTNTYERLYKKTKENVEICHIHGTANEKNVFCDNTTNMVLGIDEYLPDVQKNENLELIGFKKYYQRIIKATGNEYLTWVDDIKYTWKQADYQMQERVRERLWLREGAKAYDIKNVAHRLYVFGHSLGKTDGDVFKRLICNDNVQTTIFYHSKKSFKDIVRNLVQVIVNISRQGIRIGTLFRSVDF